MEEREEGSLPQKRNGPPKKLAIQQLYCMFNLLYSTFRAMYCAVHAVTHFYAFCFASKVPSGLYFDKCKTKRADNGKLFHLNFDFSFFVGGTLGVLSVRDS